MAHWYPLAVSLWIFGLEKTCHLNVPLLGSLIWFISYAAEKTAHFHDQLTRAYTNDRLYNVIHGSLDTQFSPSFCVSTAFKWDWSIPNFGIQARAQ